ncbi:MAG: hypothetical protein M3081_06245 [Gemmatimonadota bacterium]|nr:hypothetical protein [Gemmatimonadota bacterium]
MSKAASDGDWASDRAKDSPADDEIERRRPTVPRVGHHAFRAFDFVTKAAGVSDRMSATIAFSLRIARVDFSWFEIDDCQA